ncbi:uncharacterized protein EI90DRAFT_111409 [Cantharellus anzutake]|nr:uncharacterized protein EI90DRAFT_111409 [Cantharellus anzutake]KAF8337118.1 hypothetical protein EI90DRAFT_111409 [Cantharellus anzutake]
MEERPPSDLFDLSVELYLIPYHEHPKVQSLHRLFSQSKAQHSQSSTPRRFSLASSVSWGFMTSTPKRGGVLDSLGGDTLRPAAEGISGSIYAKHAKRWLTDDEYASDVTSDTANKSESTQGSPLPSSGACSPQLSSLPTICGICSNCLYSNPWSNPGPPKLQTDVLPLTWSPLLHRRGSFAVPFHNPPGKLQSFPSLLSNNERLFGARSKGDQVLPEEKDTSLEAAIRGSGGLLPLVQPNSLTDLDSMLLGGAYDGPNESLFEARLESLISQEGSWYSDD